MLERAQALLEEEKPLRDGDFADPADLKLLKGYGPLTLKPWIVVANVEEGGELPAGLPEDSIAISASLESEVAGIEDPEEAKELLAGFGVDELGLDLVIRSSYRALDLITFLTTGEDETRAWEVRREPRPPKQPARSTPTSSAASSGPRSSATTNWSRPEAGTRPRRTASSGSRARTTP